MFVVKKNQFLDVEKTWICVGQFFWGGECYLVLACLCPGYYEQAKKIDGRAQHEIRMEKGWASRCWRFLPVVSFRLFYFCYPPQDGNVNVRRPFVFRPMDPTPARKRRGGSKMPTSTVSTTAILKRNSKVIPAERESSSIFFRPAAVESSEIETQHNYTAIAPPILCRFEMLHANRLAITRRIEASIGTTYTTAETCNPFDAVEIRGCPFGRVVSRTELNRSLRRKWVHWTEKGNPSSRNKKNRRQRVFFVC